ncbi:hypothetical protein GLOIN_2v1708027 [Rhizophagus clarus]|uniref:Uncharacterized protein n=1 Tax=Rhizophagus clarus TaxID=94130 RepID=A0A8H3MAL1_9GLOM|nr:hypothetical protein GLOIN_2v1708027 [Rhizophagus clarus]
MDIYSMFLPFNHSIWYRMQTLLSESNYGKLHGTYKKALSKVLHKNSKSQLLYLLQEFVENEDTDDEHSNSENEYDDNAQL